jgi:hypothetical protein
MGESTEDWEHVVIERGEGGKSALKEVVNSNGSSVMMGPSSKKEGCELARESTILLVSDPQPESVGLCHGCS